MAEFGCEFSDDAELFVLFQQREVAYLGFDTSVSVVVHCCSRQQSKCGEYFSIALAAITDNGDLKKLEIVRQFSVSGNLLREDSRPTHAVHGGVHRHKMARKQCTN